MKIYSQILKCVRSTLILGSALSFCANAQDAKVNLEGDLMVHPMQISKLFLSEADHLRGSATWDWDNLNFSKPYKTTWSNVKALGPFDIQISTENLANQEVSFTLTWNNPQFKVGTFEIHDTVKKVVGGIPLYFHLDGSCSGMAMSTPGGQWKVNGKIHWDFVANKFAVNWLDFQMSKNESAISTVDVGQCTGSAGLVQSLHDTVLNITRDRQWLESVMKSGAGDWLQTSFNDLQEKLLLPREIPMNQDLTLSWLPKVMGTMPGGLIRVAGQFTLSKPGAMYSNLNIVRTAEAEESLKFVKESGFVLPKDSLTAILSYMHNNAELIKRIKSSDIAAFQSVMSSRFMQFFVWPDLMSFSKSTVFYFDVGAAREPQLTNGQTLPSGGSVFNVQSPLLVSQWAPADKQYLPYVDFRANLSGQLLASVKDDSLIIETRLQPFKIAAQFRKEFSVFRKINNWVAESLLNSSVKSYLENTPLTLPIPKWELNERLTVHIRDLQASPTSVMIPLEFDQK